MAILTKAVLKVLQSHLSSSGYTGVVHIGEPQKPPDGWQASISLLGSGPNPGQETTLATTIERRIITISVRRAILSESPEAIEVRLDEIMGKLHEALAGDFQLGGNVRNIEPTSVNFLYEEIPTGGPEFRVARMTVAFIVDDSATHAP